MTQPKPLQSEPQKQRVILTGAGGYLGLAAWEYLAAAGQEVLALSRRKGPNLLGYQQLPDLLGSAWAMVHCAAVTDWFDSNGSMMQINRDWPVDLYRQAVQAGLESFVFISSVSAAGLEPDGTCVLETPLERRKTRRLSDYALAKASAERRLLAEPGDTRLVILRMGLIYDRDRLPISPPVVKLQAPDQRLPLVHVDNASSAILQAIANPHAQGIFNVVDPEQPYTQQLCRRLGIAIELRRPILRRLLPAARVVRSFLTRGPAGPGRARWADDLARRNRTYCTSRAVGQLAARPEVRLAQALPARGEQTLPENAPPLRTVLVGAGAWARTLLAEARATGGFDIRAICDPAPKLSRRDLRGARLYPDLERMLSRDHFDAALICTPNHLHAEQIEQLAGQVPALYVEKPLVASTGELDRVARLADDRGTFLMAGHGLSRSTTGREIQQWLDSAGTASKLRLVRTLQADYEPGNWRCDPHLCPGGVIAQLGVHLLDLAIAWLGPVNLRAFSGHCRSDTGQIWRAGLRGQAGPAALEMYVALGDRNRLEVQAEVPGGLLIAAADKLQWNLHGRTAAGPARWDDATGPLLDRLRSAFWAMETGIDPHSLAVAQAFEQALSLAQANRNALHSPWAASQPRPEAQEMRA